MDEIQEFLNGKLFVNIHDATENQLREFEEIVGLMWASEKHLWQRMEYTKYDQMYMYVGKKVIENGLCIYKTQYALGRRITIAEFLSASRTRVEISTDDILEMYGS